MSFKGKSVTAVILAAGKGSRMKAGSNKMFLKINEIPVIYRSLYRLNQIKLIDTIILVCQMAEEAQINTIIKNYKQLSKLKEIVYGGRERSDSVRNALEMISTKAGNGLVMVHDGARPFITENLVYRLLESVEIDNIAIPAIKITETVRRIDDEGAISVLNRNQLYTIQTPQVFDKSMIPLCFLGAEISGIKLTDEASYFEAVGRKVSMVEGEKWNIKLTTPEDVQWAECLLMHHHQQLKLKGLES